MATGRDVVVTGVGLVSPIGTGRQPFLAALQEGRSGVLPLEGPHYPALPADFGGQVRDFDAKQHVKPRKSLKMMCRAIQMSVASAGMAVEDATLDLDNVDSTRMGVVYGTEIYHGELEELEAVFKACIANGEFDFDRWGPSAVHEIFPLWMLKYLPNMPACQISIALDAQGPNNSITLGDASSLLAVEEAVRVIERGQADVMVAGGAGTRLNPFTMLLRHTAEYSRRSDAPEQASRPFDRDRDGFVFGEGAASLVLESRDHAEARRASILARIAGTANCFEPAKKNQPRQGSAIRATLSQCLERAELSANEVGHVSAHAMGTRCEDAVEAQAIQDVLGQVPVTALKSYFGNLGAGSGAVELAASVLALATDEVPRTLNYETPDPDCPVNVVCQQSLSGAAPSSIVLSQSEQGQAMAIALKRDS